MINLIPDLMRAKCVPSTEGLSALDNQRLASPPEAAKKVVEFEHDTPTNANLGTAAALGELPAKVISDAVVHLSGAGSVSDGCASRDARQGVCPWALEVDTTSTGSFR
jgi:hypothetical protein